MRPRHPNKGHRAGSTSHAVFLARWVIQCQCRLIILRRFGLKMISYYSVAVFYHFLRPLIFPPHKFIACAFIIVFDRNRDFTVFRSFGTTVFLANAEHSSKMDCFGKNGLIRPK